MASPELRSPPVGLALLFAVGLLGLALGVGALGASHAGQGALPSAGLVVPETTELREQSPWPAEIRRLRFGVTPYLDDQGVESALRPIVDHLSERLPVPVELVIAKSYADLGAQLRAQQLDLAKFSPLSYVEAKQADPGMQILLTQVAAGSTTYLGYVYTRVDSDVEQLEDLAQRSFCYVDEQSTSGYLYPRALLRAHGLDPEQLFSYTVFGGNHLACMRMVIDGEVDAGAAFSGAFRAGRLQGMPVSELKILGKTARIPYDAYCVRSQLPAMVARRIEQALLALSTRSPEGSRVLVGGAGQFNAWTVAHDSDYDSVRQALALSQGAVPMSSAEPTR